VGSNLAPYYLENVWKSFKKVDHIDYKIIAFEVKKGAFFCTLQNRVSKLQILLAYIVALYKVEAFEKKLTN
jgi:hypothetical protein